MNNLSFSWIGMIFLIMLMIPNLIWNQNKPTHYEDYVQNENKFLLFLERGGEICTTGFALFSYEDPLNAKWILIVAIILMLLYEYYWVQYFLSKKTMNDFYRSLFGIPVAGASLPVLAFLTLGFYTKNLFLILSVILLGIGHIGIHLNHKKEISQTPKVK